MISITISEEVEDYSELSGLLQEIARQLESGNTSGYYPSWSTSGEEENQEPIEDCQGVCL